MQPDARSTESSLRPPAYVLVGPTASGKSRVAQAIAEKKGWAILSADSMVVYRGMDIGTAKPSVGERARVRTFGVDLTEPDRAFSVADWLVSARAAFNAEPAAPVVVVGGTGLYLRCLVEGLDPAGASTPELRARWQRVFAEGGTLALQQALQERAPAVLASLADPGNSRRLIRALERVELGAAPSVRTWSEGPARAPFVGLRWPRPALKTNIELRVRAMYDDGLIEEVERLLRAYTSLSETARQAIGYAEAINVLAGRCTRDEAMTMTMRRTRQYAKRQRTWFERQARVRWVDVDPAASTEETAGRVLACWELEGPVCLAGIGP